jgi:hypothetical protein
MTGVERTIHSVLDETDVENDPVLVYDIRDNVRKMKEVFDI